MTEDRVILGISLFGCIIFVVFFSLLIRRSPTYPIRTIFSSFIPTSFITMIFSWIATPVLSIMLVSFFLYTLLAAFYILGVYLNIDSSLHVRILQEVAIAGRMGLTYKELLKRYNKETILQKRISWLTNSGEIEKVGSFFRRRRRFSTLLLREKFIVFLTKLYGSKSLSSLF